MRIKAVLFDIDGTLIDSNDLHVRVWEEAFRRHGITVDPGDVHTQIGKGGDMLVPALAPDADTKTQEKISDAHGAIFKARFLDRVKAFPQARDLLRRVHEAGQKVVLASSASKEELDHYLDLLDVRSLVAATTSIDDVQNSKPAPDIFATALKKLAPLEAEEAMAVGDTPYDVDAAKQSGIATIALRSGKFSDDVLSKAGAVALYDDAAALLAGFDASPLAR